jgi:uncharacterized protein (TIGR00730 family)
MSFHYFFSRKVMLDFSADAFVFFPGGFGTLDEFFELVTLMQTGKVHRSVPIVLVGSEFWQPLVDWMRRQMLERLRTVMPDDLELWTLADDLDAVVAAVRAGEAEVAAHRAATTGRAAPTPDDKLRQATEPMRRSGQ